MGSLRAQCSTCSAFLKQGPATGVCRAKPPAVLLVGVQQKQSPIKGLPGHGMVDAILQSAFPPVQNTGWCREWEPTIALEAEFRRQSNGQGQAETEAASEAQA